MNSLRIIGAGPVGLLLAIRAARAGREVTIVEKRSGIPDRSMAIGITPPSLMILEELGLRQAFEQEGVLIRNARVYEQRKQVGSLSFERTGGHILSLPQRTTLRLLREHLATFPNAQVLENTPFDPSEPLPDDTWLVGCDGARSAVREHAGIGWRESPYSQRFLMADFEDIERAGSDARLFFSPLGSVESFPLPHGFRRWVVQISKDAPENVPFLIERVQDAAGVDLHGCAHGTPSLFQHRVALANTYFKDRTLLCGDAAHLLSPIGGQGMNTGFMDAWTLADLLDSGEPTPRDLNRWTRSRQKAFRQAATRAAWGMRMGTLRHRPASVVRAGLLNIALRLPASRDYLASTFSMLNLPRPAPL
jgi:2-polyprenyl-6-methoxyphenol hydroxylase-like FAD-dependent oxidoreductase